MKIRKATIRDARALCEYMKVIRAESPTTLFRRDKDPTIEEERDYIAKANQNGIIFVCCNRGIVGLIVARIPKQAQRNHTCEFGMSVSREYRGHGIGTRLLETLMDWARKKKLRRIECAAFENNHGAIGLYKRHGFSIEGKRKQAIEIGGKYLDIIELGKIVTMSNNAVVPTPLKRGVGHT